MFRKVFSNSESYFQILKKKITFQKLFSDFETIFIFGNILLIILLIIQSKIYFILNFRLTYSEIQNYFLD